MSATMPRRSIAIRVPTDALQVIDQEAQRRQLSRTEYIVQASTGTLEEHTTDILERLNNLEQDMARAQEIIYSQS